MKYFLLIACFVTVLMACDDDTKVCDLDTRTEARARFRWQDPNNNNVEEDTTMPKVTLFALNKDSIYKKQTGLSGMQFQLDRLTDSSKFYFQTDSTRIADTITFFYTRQPHFISAGCGVVMYFNIDTVYSTQHVIKSLVISSKQVTEENENTIILHF
ncbi:DUF6452 family protein [Chitinophaga barathri]|uniref:Uncharacterized protein n=1 Tax=Chitinophaga barathri TaxID=1647451 RepID=A0A3N4M6U6_9BACT|nr:DUF6452 family protein [Chitinophaga barathri]RPD39092.1 hypothetical protein EG028_20965 [Chitinophaga barathri]